MKIKKNDKVKIISGKDRGESGRILEVYYKRGKILVEGLNMQKKHKRPKKQGEKGEIINLPRPMDISNVMIICPSCGQPARLGYKLNAGKKSRCCKKCKSLI